MWVTHTLKRDLDGRALHVAIGIVERGKHLVAELWLVHQIREGGGRTEYVRIVVNARLMFEQSAKG